ncbi:heavy-metal-associated domain-containing protein [Novosphingobium olei]|uniref:heavy-metal-associated domain-containing protein n=1 Tax=Novosphingobium olei TaxID=2728851 RepID=UPI001F0E9171|nr:heavy-metal-associated domain-containing protein [Novosphingobium olei]
MAVFTLPNRAFRPRKALLVLGGGVALALAGAGLYAQIEGDRGIPPIASTGDFEISGIEVNATGDNAEAARAAGWREAQRKAWEQLWAKNGLGGGTAPALDAGTLDGMVSAIVVENEQIGPHRYIATLGVIFDRARTGGYLGMQGQVARSAPMLVIPVLYQGGVGSVFETRTPWQKAWAEFRTGESVIDYVRPTGSGADSLLLTEGQITRRSRNWWRMILDEFGAADVVIPIARLQREFPGGPVHGTFSARYGPDNRYLGSFEMTAVSEDKLPAMLNEAVKRIDGLYAAALAAGKLTPDATLVVQPQIDPKLVDEVLAKSGPVAAGPVAGVESAPVAAATTASQTQTFTVQFSTPDAVALDAGLAAVRAVAGVQGATVSSLAIGGMSVIRATYAGDLEALSAGLKAQGWKVTQGAGAIVIRK